MSDRRDDLWGLKLEHRSVTYCDLSIQDRDALLWDEAPSPELSWHVLHVKSRQEKVLAMTLAAQHIAHFLPLSPRPTFRGRRSVTVLEPLFPGYLFLRGSLDDAYEADRTGRVVDVLPVADQHRLHEELKSVHAALSRRAVLNPYPYLWAGRRVEVRSGPFRGLRGVVKDIVRPERLILQVAMLGQAISMQIHGALVEPLD